MNCSLCSVDLMCDVDSQGVVDYTNWKYTLEYTKVEGAIFKLLSLFKTNLRHMF